jgi:hypothetical protein
MKLLTYNTLFAGFDGTDTGKVSDHYLIAVEFTI